MAAVGGHPLLHLGLHRGVPAQQGQIAVGGGGGDDFEDPGVHQPPEGPDQILAKILAEGPLHFPVAGFPHLGHGGEMLISQLLEGGQVILGRLDLFVQVVLELLAKDVGGQHLRQNGGDSQGNPGFEAFGAQAVEGLEQGDVRFGRGLVEPIHAVGPAAVADDVREMGMEHKGEISQGFSHDVLQAKVGESRRKKIRLWEYRET